MKKTLSIILIFILFSLCFTGCKTQDKYKNLGNEYNQNTDYAYSFDYRGSDACIAPTDKGYYFLNRSFLYYTDKSNMKPVVLCNRPDCKHEHETNPEEIWKCDAYLGFEMIYPFIQFYEGDLYALSTLNKEARKHENTLVQISPDGSNRKKIMDIAPDSGVVIHRGYVYISYIKDNKAKVKRINLSKPKEDGQVIYTAETTESALTLTPIGNYVYIKEIGVLEEQQNMVGRLYAYDIKNDSVKKLITNENDAGYDVFLSGVYKQQLVYTLYQPDSADIPNKLSICSLNGEDTKEFADFSNDSTTFAINLRNDEKYFYKLWKNNMINDTEINKQRKIVMCDENLNPINEISIGDFSTNYWFFPGDDDYMFFYHDGLNRETFNIQYIDKSDFKNGKATLQTLFEGQKTFYGPNYISMPSL